MVCSAQSPVAGNKRLMNGYCGIELANGLAAVSSTCNSSQPGTSSSEYQLLGEKLPRGATLAVAQCGSSNGSPKPLKPFAPCTAASRSTRERLPSSSVTLTVKPYRPGRVNTASARAWPSGRSSMASRWLAAQSNTSAWPSGSYDSRASSRRVSSIETFHEAGSDLRAATGAALPLLLIWISSVLRRLPHWSVPITRSVCSPSRSWMPLTDQPISPVQAGLASGCPSTFTWMTPYGEVPFKSTRSELVFIAAPLLVVISNFLRE